MTSKLTRFIKRNCGQFFSMFCKRDRKLFVFGSWYGRKFADNPKYLYLYCIKHGINAFWITKEESIFGQLKKLNFPVEMAYSKNGKRICKKAKYIVTCTGVGDVNENCIGGAVLIDTTHGLPLKKYLYDDRVNSKCYTLSFRINSFFEKLPQRKNYVVSSSPTVTDIYVHAFKTTKKRILELGMPRNDCFFDGSLKKLIFPDRDYRKLILYLPTHRNEGKTKIQIENIFNLSELNDYLKSKGILFVIKKHFYHNGEKENLSKFSNIIDLTGMNYDTQELMFSSDFLITDYSSCFIDYLLLDRPIMFYAYDYDEYQKMDRELYFNYDEIAPGNVCKNVIDFQKCLSQMVENNSMEKQLRTKNIYYSLDNQGQVSEKFINTLLDIK